MGRKEFLELAAKHCRQGISEEEKQRIESRMREILIERNDGKTSYTILYATPGEVHNIQTCAYSDLLAVDFDIHYNFGK